MHFPGSTYLQENSHKPTKREEFLMSANANRISNSWRKAAVTMRRLIEYALPR
jgi:hypothetical protein